MRYHCMKLENVTSDQGLLPRTNTQKRHRAIQVQSSPKNRCWSLRKQKHFWDKSGQNFANY